MSGPVWRRLAAIGGGAIMIGLLALLFAEMVDAAGQAFGRLVQRWRWAPLAITPVGFVAIVWLTRWFAPDAKGSGIPQVMAATADPDAAMKRLLSLRTTVAKLFLTAGALLVGGSVGREGPTVQIGASVMGYAHKVMRVPLRASVFIAGGAAGVAAAFNTPLAGVAFAIEELAAAYEQRVTLLVMATADLCGLIVALVGVASGLSWETGYETARSIISGGAALWWYGPAIFVATLATALSGLPGGIFAPSLSTGAGLGQLLRSVFPDDPGGAVALLGMTAYFTGVVRAPLTAVIIVSETTGSRAMLLPLLAAALVADFVARTVSPEKLYHGLSRRFAP